jgi:tRNA (cytosine34-C5)-methyltransferase
MSVVQRRPGVTTWRVMDVDHFQTWIDKFDDVPEARRWRMPASLFPKGDGSNPAHAASAEPISSQLRRCWRLYPHLQDTGGFFIALIRKRASLPASAMDNLPAPPDLFGRKRCMDLRKEMEAQAKAEAKAAEAAAKAAAAEAAEVAAMTQEEGDDEAAGGAGVEVGAEAEAEADEEGEEEGLEAAENDTQNRCMPLSKHVNGQQSWQLIKAFYEVR